MRICCDIDGVLLDFVSAFCNCIREKYGWTLRPADIYQFDIAEILGISKIRFEYLIDETLTKFELEPIPGAFEGIKTLKDEGHEIHIVTSRDQKHYLHTAVNIAEYMDNPFGVVYTNGRTKKDLCGILQAQIMIDDSLKILDDFYDTCRIKNNWVTRIYGQDVLILRQPWNENGINLESNYKLCQDWKEIVVTIEVINGSNR